MAKSPMSIGSNGIPDLMAKNPNVNLDIPPRGSWPIIATTSPMKHIISPLTNIPVVVAEIIMRLSKMMAASSGGPIFMARIAMGPMNKIVRISLDRSPLTEAKSAISMALRDCPFLVKAGPSNVVATAAPVPGMETRIAGMLPP